METEKLRSTQVTDQEWRDWEYFCAFHEDGWWSNAGCIKQDYARFINAYNNGITFAKEKMVRFIAWKLSR